jgi:hypothetical protein
MQDRKTYANGNTLTTEGFRCSIGEPIDIIVDEDLPFSYNANIDTGKQMLVTLEVDGEIVCYRELHDFEVVNDDELAIVVGDYTINLDANELTGEYTSARIRLEPVEVYTSDAFRAAVAKTAPKASGGGGSGDGVLVVTDTDGTLDKTWQEIHDAFVAGSVRVQKGTDTDTLVSVSGVEYSSKGGMYIVAQESTGNWGGGKYTASSASGYPVLEEE